MTSYVFALKKLVRNGSLMIVVCLALCLSGIHYISSQSHTVQDQFNSADLELYSMEFMMTFTRQGGEDASGGVFQSISPGQAHLWSLMEDPAAEIQETGDGLGRTVANKDLEVQYIKEALAMDGIELTGEEATALAYFDHVAHYIQDQKATDPDYQPQGAVTTLLMDGSLLFGLIPLLVLTTLGIRLVTDEWEDGSVVFQKTLPVKEWQVYVTYFLAQLTLLVLYFFLVTVATCGIHGLMGDGLGDFPFPYRVLHPGFDFLPAYQVYLMYGVIFLVKGALFLALAQVLGTFFRRSSPAYLTNIAILAIGGIGTVFVPAWQVAENPFYMSLQAQVMGSLKWQANQGSSQTHYLVGEAMGGGILAIWLFLSLFGLALGLYLYQRKASLLAGQAQRHQAGVAYPVTRPWQMEMAKLNQVMSRSFLYGMLAVVAVSLISIVLLDDYQYLDQPVVANYFQEDYPQILAYYEDEIQAYEDALADLTPGSMEAEAIKAWMEETATHNYGYYEEIYNQINKRQSAYQGGDTQAYYETFDTELAVYYNPNQTYQRFQDGAYYMPREGYYQTGDFPSIYGYYVSQDRIQELSQRDIRPIIGAGVTMTEYDLPRQLGDQVREGLDLQFRDMSSLGLWYRLIHTYRLDGILLLIVLLACGGGYSLEGRRRSSLAWMYTLPQDRQSVLHYKLAVAGLRLLGIIGMAVLLVCVAGLAREGFGQVETPMLYYDQVVDLGSLPDALDQSYHWVDLGQSVLQSMTYLVLGASFVVMVAFIGSTYASQTSLVVLGTLLVLVLGYGLSYLPLDSWQAYLPFHYLNIGPMMDGSYRFEVDLYRIRPGMGYLVLIVWNSLAYTILRIRTQSMKVLN